MLYGKIHSIESCGTLDGPGLRFVIFTQGCYFRCLYCHNRDTWDLDNPQAKEYSVDDLMKQVLQYRHYFAATGGGVTASGGEALLQAEFIADWFEACQAKGIHTCLDTNGYALRFDDTLTRLLDHSDLVMLDLKQLNPEKHLVLTGISNTRTLKFALLLQERKQLTRIRYVVVPGYSDDDDSAHRLGQFIAPMGNIECVELLPYHELGSHKWALCGDKNPLEGVKRPPKETIDRVASIIRNYGHKVIF